jgi:mersacidin/lichenicidin family type 2 lantibiotic
MTNERIVTAWRNTDYRARLTAAEREALPANPAGESALADIDLDIVTGGDTCHCQTLGCCGGFTSDPGYCSWVCPTMGETCYCYTAPMMCS